MAIATERGGVGRSNENVSQIPIAKSAAVMIATITRRRRFTCSRVRIFIALLYLGSGNVHDSAPLARTPQEHSMRPPKELEDRTAQYQGVGSPSVEWSKMTPIRGGPHARDNDKDSARSASLGPSGLAVGRPAITS